jgi:CPA2 family monovalent cation:H+ antiporter-2
VVLILLPMVALPASGGSNWRALFPALGAALGKFALLVGLVIVLGTRLVPALLNKTAGSSEIFNLTVPVVALGTAWIAADFFGVSLALGSFLAGVVAGQSQ